MYTSRYTGLSRNRRGTNIPLLSVWFFPAALLYHELLLRAFDRDTAFFSLALLRVVLFSLAAGLAVALILDLLPWKTAGRIAGGVLLGLGAVLFHCAVKVRALREFRAAVNVGKYFHRFTLHEVFCN